MGGTWEKNAAPEVREQLRKSRLGKKKEQHKVWRDTHPHYKEAKRRSANKYKKAHPEKRRLQRNAWQKKRNQETRKFIWSYKLGHPCVDCGEADPVCLDFDHRDRKAKKFNIAHYRSRSLTIVKAEIEKCDCRCANCHRKRTAEQLGFHKDV